MTNPKRGEIKINLADQTFTGRITLDVDQRIEMGLDMGVIEIAQHIQSGKLKISEATFIIHPVVKAGGNDISEKEIGQLCWKTGLAKSLAIVAEIVALILDPNGDSEGNVEVTAQTS